MATIFVGCELAEAAGVARCDIKPPMSESYLNVCLCVHFVKAYDFQTF